MVPLRPLGELDLRNERRLHPFAAPYPFGRQRDPAARVFRFGQIGEWASVGGERPQAFEKLAPRGRHEAVADLRHEKKALAFVIPEEQGVERAPSLGKT